MKYQKFQALISKKKMYLFKKKNDQMLWFVQKPNEKLLRFVIIFLWEVIYAHFYNWDSPLDLVLVVYDLIELIIETSLWSKDYSTFDTHPQHTRLRSINAYLICVIVHVQMWCVCAQPYVDQTKNIFVLFVCFGSDLYHPYFSKFFKLFLCEKLIFWVFLWPISCISSTGS